MNAHRSIPRLAMLALSLSVAGCAPYLGSAKAREVDKTVPESYGESHETKNSARLTVDEFFADPNLVSLVEQALANNQELPVTLADARMSMELITAIYASAESGQAESLPLHKDHPKYQGWTPL